MIGRMYAAHPGEGERYYMRMLLNHVTGCTSYVDVAVKVRFQSKRVLTSQNAF